MKKHWYRNDMRIAKFEALKFGFLFFLGRGFHAFFRDRIYIRERVYRNLPY